MAGDPRRVLQAKRILGDLGLPAAQRNTRSALTLLALAQIRRSTPWSAARTPALRTVDIMDFMRRAYGKDYKPNTRETVRRQTLHQFEQARIVDRNPDAPDRPTNSGATCYRLTPEAATVVRSFGRGLRFAAAVGDFKGRFGALQERYASRRSGLLVPLRLPDGSTAALSPGEHNELQAAIVRDFGPRFAAGAEVLYVGDTADKCAVRADARLAELGIDLAAHGKAPDVVLYAAARNWVFFVEAATTHGPVSSKRLVELKNLAGAAAPRTVYVSAFPSRAVFRKYAADVAWDTEVWIAEAPDHLVHFNGDRFLGPR